MSEEQGILDRLDEVEIDGSVAAKLQVKDTAGDKYETEFDLVYAEDEEASDALTRFNKEVRENIEGDKFWFEYFDAKSMRTDQIVWYKVTRVRDNE